MTDIQRVKKVVNWLIYEGFAANEKEVADKLGYTKSSFSQIVTGKVPLSGKFLKKLCSANADINESWIQSGLGEMLYSEMEEDQDFLDYLEDSEQKSKMVGDVHNLNSKVKSLEETILILTKNQEKLLRMQESLISSNEKLTALLERSGNSFNQDPSTSTK